MSSTDNDDRWRPCSSCKEPIPFAADYYVCNVSTCNRGGNKGFVFCSVSCWDMHLGIVQHRKSWAEDAKAPTRAEFERSQAGDSTKKAAKASPAEPAKRERRRILPQSSPARAPATEGDDLPKETLIVMSKLKSYVKAKAGINCSDRVAGPLSDAVRRLCDEAIEEALADERKTLLDRDFRKR